MDKIESTNMVIPRTHAHGIVSLYTSLHSTTIIMPKAALSATESSALSSDENECSEDDLVSGATNQLTRALDGLSALKRRLKVLRRQNEDLQKRLDAREGQIKSPNRKPSAAVKALEVKVHALEEARARDKKKIRKFELEELRKEAEGLQEDREDDVLDDRAHTMRKLLRRFQDLMSAETIELDEACPICMESMKINRASSLPCGHVLCTSCLSQIIKLKQGEETIACPECRKVCPRDAPETVAHTEETRWDGLLELAKQWAKIDRRTEAETSEEEQQEDFIEEQDASDPHPGSDSERGDEARRASTPLTNEESTGYNHSPVSQKRKRMEFLVEQRSQKLRL